MIKHISGMVLVAFVGSAQVFAQVDSSKFVLKEVVVKENRMQIPFLKVFSLNKLKKLKYIQEEKRLKVLQIRNLK